MMAANTELTLPVSEMLKLVSDGLTTLCNGKLHDAAAFFRGIFPPPPIGYLEVPNDPSVVGVVLCALAGFLVAFQVLFFKF